MNCKNCEYGLKQRCGDFEKIICTYEEGECVKITELEKKNKALRQDWEIMKNTIADYNDFCDKYIKLEKEKAELEAQIEKMKCCGNCVHFDFNEPNYCHKGVYRERQYVCGKWCFGN